MTSRRIYFRVASPAVTSVGTSSRILRLRSSRPPHPPTTHPGPGALPPIYKHHALENEPNWFAYFQYSFARYTRSHVIRGRTHHGTHAPARALRVLTSLHDVISTWSPPHTRTRIPKSVSTARPCQFVLSSGMLCPAPPN